MLIGFGLGVYFGQTAVGTFVGLGIGFILFGLVRYLSFLRSVIKSERPDFIYVGSDVYHVVLASFLSKIYSVPYIVDLYDNYESFAASRVPGVIRLFRKSVVHANGVTCVSNQLSEHVKNT